MATHKPGFDKLVKYVGHAFYSGEFPPRASSGGIGKGKDDIRGMACLMLEALTRREWVKEDILADELFLNVQQARRVLRQFEQEQLVMRVHRKETKRGGAELIQRQEGAPSRAHTHSYCCLDYARFMDTTRLRIHLMRKKIEDELKDGSKVTEYKCPRPGCELHYTALDVFKLLDPMSGTFNCDACKMELVTVIGEGGAGPENVVTGSDEDRRARQAQLKQELASMDEQVQRITELLKALEATPPPDYGDLLDWERDRRARGLDTTGATKGPRGGGPGAGGLGAAMGGGPALGAGAKRDGPPQLQSLEGYGAGETKVTVDLGDGEGEGGEKKAADKKPLPPWLMRQGMQQAADGSAAEAAPPPPKAKTEDELRREAFLEAMKLSMQKKQQGAGAEAGAGVAVKQEVQVGSKRSREEAGGRETAAPPPAPVPAEGQAEDQDDEFEDVPSGTSAPPPPAAAAAAGEGAAAGGGEEEEEDWEDA